MLNFQKVCLHWQETGCQLYYVRFLHCAHYDIGHNIIINPYKSYSLTYCIIHRLPRTLPSQSEDDVTLYKTFNQSQNGNPKCSQSQLGCSNLDQSEEGGDSTFADIVASADDEFLATAFSAMFVEMEQEREIEKYFFKLWYCNQKRNIKETTLFLQRIY